MKKFFASKKKADTAKKTTEEELKPFDDDIEENTLSEVKTSSNAKNKGIGVIFIIIVAFFAIGIIARSVLKNNQTQQQSDLSSELEQKKETPDINQLPEIASEVELPDTETASDTQLPIIASDIQPINVNSPGENVPSQSDLRLASPLMAGGSSGSGLENNTNTTVSGAEMQRSDGNNQFQTENIDSSISMPSNNKLGSMLNPTVTIGTMAGKFGNLNLILTKGAFIPCNLKTRLETQIAGMVLCVLPRDIYSSNGKVILLEKGSIVTGEFQRSAEMGMSRIFVLWTRIQTPKGVYVNIDSPATDELGGSGIAGKVKNHWWKRFGNALLFSLIQDGITSGFDRLSRDDNNNNNIVYSNSQSTSDEIIKEILKSTSNIPPTIYRGQGSTVGIYLGRDLNFESVYRLRSY